MMNDTQWPRFQVFVQEKESASFEDFGSVHAPDPDLALFNARDVFARRPQCVAMWIVPAEAIFSRTAEEIQAQDIQPLEEYVSAGQEYWVFSKNRSAGTQTLRGKLCAASPLQALRLALARFQEKQPAFAWWIIPARLVVASDPEDVDSLYAPAQDKKFRMATDFHTHTAMREISSRKESEAPDG